MEWMHSAFASFSSPPTPGALPGMPIDAGADTGRGEALCAKADVGIFDAAPLLTALPLASRNAGAGAGIGGGDGVQGSPFVPCSTFVALEAMSLPEDAEDNVPGAPMAKTLGHPFGFALAVAASPLLSRTIPPFCISKVPAPFAPETPNVAASNAGVPGGGANTSRRAKGNEGALMPTLTPAPEPVFPVVTAAAANGPL